VLNAVIGGLVVVYGIWLRYIINEQLKSKDTAIQALEAAIKLNEAHIASLKSDTAPAIAQNYATMKQHANQMAEEFNGLSKRFERTTTMLRVAPVQRLLSESDGLLLSTRILQQYLGNIMFPGATPDFSVENFKSYFDGLIKTMAAFNSEVDTRNQKAKELMAALPGMNL